MTNQWDETVPPELAAQAAILRPATVDDALEALLHFSPRRSPGHDALATSRELLRRLGNPQEAQPAVHVAGTSGKTSVATQIRDLLVAIRQRPGLTVSPHITSVTERVQVGSEPLAEDQFLDRVGELLAVARAWGAELTYFELVVALAFRAFATEHVDTAVIEVGIGGTRDATNVITRPDKIAVITAIGFDHTEILGHTIAEIAAHKAGIIGASNDAFVLEQDERVLDVVTRRAADVGARLTVVPPVADGLDGYRAGHAALARSVAATIAQRTGVAPPSIPAQEAAADARPPARYEVFHLGGHRLVLDGAHNPQKMAGLVSELHRDGVQHAAVLATLTLAPDDKLDETLSVLKQVASWLVVPDYVLGSDGKTKQSFPRAEVIAAARAQGVDAVGADSVGDALAMLLERGERDLVVTGSLYLASLVRPLLGA